MPVIEIQSNCDIDVLRLPDAVREERPVGRRPDDYEVGSEVRGGLLQGGKILGLRGSHQIHRSRISVRSSCADSWERGSASDISSA